VFLALTVGAIAFVSAPQLDTTVAAERGQRLEVNAFGGEIAVRTWNRNAVRVEASTSSPDRLKVSSSATTISVRSEGRHGPPADLDIRISAPSWMAVALSGVHTDMKVDGSQAPISAETVEGDVRVTGGNGLISLRSVQGGVTLKGAKGRITVNSVNEDVEVTNAAGEITAETVNGEIRLDGVDAVTADANTVNGDISYLGPIRDGGRYSLSTHNGDINLSIAEGTNARVSVSTYDGEFESEFPVPVSTQKGKGFSFSLGSGSAQVSLESFQGTIQLFRPGSAKASEHRHNHQDKDGED
jgi:Putative adhesin